MQLYRDFSCSKEIERQYNPGLSIHDGRNWIEWYRKESKQARVELTCTLGCRYGPTLDEYADIFPAQSSGAPVLVFIHGGSWRFGNSRDFSFIARGLVPNGITVVVANYSLCPGVPLSEITRQNRALLAWLHGHADTFHGCRNSLFVAGHSAGGQQAAMMASTPWQKDYGLPDNLIKGCIPISGIYDLRPLRYSSQYQNVTLSHEIIYHQSPLNIVPQQGPPLLVSLGSEESAEFHRQAQTYLRAWHAKNLQANLHIQQGKHHFSTIEGFVEKADPLSRLVAAFIHNQQLKSQSDP
ncbi:alpha/beta hydrolase [Desulfogranum japonicum]|uniref:alpha/beta hydrolase n=1 Tax=Desulfogranum japonicum TaxID=231447 RepID=UPI0003F711C1|nr:alpha/beta hydrolase [Desulfogranum japonicum]